MVKKNVFILILSCCLLFCSGCDEPGNDELIVKPLITPPTPAIPWEEAEPIFLLDLYSMALGVNDATIQLGVMCSEVDYGDGNIGSSLSTGFGGDGNVLVLHEYDTENAAWVVAGGRTTPQRYQYSELLYNDGDSYYSTNYSAFGGLLAVVKNGGSGTSALEGGLYHDIAIKGDYIYSLALQETKNTAWTNVEGGLSLYHYDKTKFAVLGGASSGTWHRDKVDAEYEKISDPCLITAGDFLVGAYIKDEGDVDDGKVYVRKTSTPVDITDKVDINFPAFGPDIKGVREVELAWDGTSLFLAAIASDNVLTVYSCDLSNDPLVWVIERILPHVDDVDFAATTNKVALAIRQEDTVQVYGHVGYSTPQQVLDIGGFDGSSTGRTFDIEGVGTTLVLSAWHMIDGLLYTYRLDGWN